MVKLFAVACVVSLFASCSDAGKGAKSSASSAATNATDSVVAAATKTESGENVVSPVAAAAVEAAPAPLQVQPPGVDAATVSNIVSSLTSQLTAAHAAETKKLAEAMLAAQKASDEAAAKRDAEAKAERKAAEDKAEKEKKELEAKFAKQAADDKAAAEKAAKEKKEADAKAEKKAAEDKVAAEKKAAEEKADAETRRKTISSRTWKLQFVSSDDVAEKLNAMWSGDFGEKWKTTKVAQSFPDANVVMVSAPGGILDACDDVIRAIDVQPMQVYVEARFVELANNASHKLGIDWTMLDGMKGSLAIDAGYDERKMTGVATYNSGTGVYTLSTDDKHGSQSANLSHMTATLGMDELYVVLRALEGSEDARTFSNPKIIVSSGKKAKVDMTEKYPNVNISAKRTSSGSSDSMDLSMSMASIPGEDKMMFAKEAFFSWGIQLEVTPRISTNGIINVSIVPTISSQTDWVTAGANDTSKKDSNVGSYSSRYPVIDVQRLVTEFSMKSETTAVIGGLSRTVEEQVDTGIPWLRDLKWVGPRLFGSKQRVKMQKEIIVFVTVGIVDPNHIKKDQGLPKNAVLGRQYVDDVRREPGDRRRLRPEGMESLDLRSLEEQAKDPRWLKRSEEGMLKRFPMPFTKKVPEDAAIDELGAPPAENGANGSEPSAEKKAADTAAAKEN